ncbi:MAG TPA: hypothetical protein VHA37_01455 [Candidatus Saccharimonadales bacterium]|nr:hypothetical protein [Candidatus Saccharimonadales bacterium]
MSEHDQPEPPRFNPHGFNTSSYVKRIDKPWGYELHWVPADAPYMGKILHINQRARLSLQLHDQKQESWFLMHGQAAVIWENDQGELVQTELQAGQGYTTQIGQRHRLVGLTDCDVIEVSTPELGTTWRLEDDYARPHETPEQRERERS